MGWIFNGLIYLWVLLFSFFFFLLLLLLDWIFWVLEILGFVLRRDAVEIFEEVKDVVGSEVELRVVVRKGGGRVLWKLRFERDNNG